MKPAVQLIWRYTCTYAAENDDDKDGGNFGGSEAASEKTKQVDSHLINMLFFCFSYSLALFSNSFPSQDGKSPFKLLPNHR